MKQIATILLLYSLGIATATTTAVAQDSQQRTKFFTRQRITRVIVLSAEAAYDSWSTQQILAKHGVEHDPIARPFVTRGPAGQAAISVIGVGSSIGLSYMLELKRHKKLASTIEQVVLISEGANCVHNAYVLETMQDWRK